MKDLFTEMDDLITVNEELSKIFSRLIETAFKWEELRAAARMLPEIGDEMKAIVEAYYKGKLSEDTVRLMVSTCNASIRESVTALELHIQALKLCEKAKEHLINCRALTQRARQYAYETFK